MAGISTKKKNLWQVQVASTSYCLARYMSSPFQGETNELIVTRDWSHKTLNIVILVETLNIV